MMAANISSILPVLCLLALGGAVQGAAPSLGDLGGSVSAKTNFATRFAFPPAATRIHKIIHGWPDDAGAQDELIGKLVRQGFGGVVCNVSFTDYLESDAKWEAFTRAVREARKAGLALWLYDERGYPSGNAGGLVLRDRLEWEARGLLMADAETKGGPLTLTLPPGKPFLVAAYPLQNGLVELRKKLDLSAFVRLGQLQWQAPQGHWRVLAITENRLFEGTHAELNLWDKIPCANLLLPEPTARFLEVTHQRYAAHLGDDLGQFFLGTFTDEPSLMSLFLKPMPYRVLPWATNLPPEFKRRRGYALDPVVPALVLDTGPGSQRARYDFWRTVGELVATNFFGQIQGWCRQHKVPSGGHLLMEESLVAQVPLYGDFFRCIRRLDAPSIDCLTSLPPEVPWWIARLLASAAELESRSLVMCETSDHAQRYRPPGDARGVQTVSEAEIRGTCNRLMVSGVNDITSYYSFSDLTDEQLRRLNLWVGRCGTLLRGGHQVADVALLYPVESVWPRFNPARHWANESPAATRIENILRAAADTLFTNQRDFTFVDGRALAEATVAGGTLAHGPLRWRVVVLPGADTLPLAAWENLARFVRGGGVVIALGALPANSETQFPSPRVQALARELFGDSQDEPRMAANAAGGTGILLPAGAEGLLVNVLNSVLEPDVRVAYARSPFRVTHRRIDRGEVYFVINDGSQFWQGEVTFAAAGKGEQWDPATGQLIRTNTGQRLMLSLEPYGATALRFPAARLPTKYPVKPGILPNLAFHALPEVAPTALHGEFVEAEVAANPGLARPGRPVWQATGHLTKGQTDTWLFAQFLYPQPVNLVGTDCLLLETWVPEGQNTANQILVILHEQNGGDFLASTSRSLGTPGYNRTVVPISQFRLAGWSNDSDNTLDLKRISEIRVGWGGYLGTEGETVQFSVALPQAGAAVGP